VAAFSIYVSNEPGRYASGAGLCDVENITLSGGKGSNY